MVRSCLVSVWRRRLLFHPVQELPHTPTVTYACRYEASLRLGISILWPRSWNGKQHVQGHDLFWRRVWKTYVLGLSLQRAAYKCANSRFCQCWSFWQKVAFTSTILRVTFTSQSTLRLCCVRKFFCRVKWPTTGAMSLHEILARVLLIISFYCRVPPRLVWSFTISVATYRRFSQQAVSLHCKSE